MQPVRNAKFTSTYSGNILHIPAILRKLTMTYVEMERVALAASPEPQATTLSSPIGDNNGKRDGVHRRQFSAGCS